jgi:benzoylformate decarboxylase
MFTAWHWSCTDAQTMPEVVRRAFKFAHTPPGAPVTLDFPPDLLGQKVNVPIYRMDAKDVRPVFRSGPGLVEKAARWLVEAKAPVFIVGPEVSRTGANRAMIRMAEKLGVPVCQEDDLFCDFPTTHPLYLGSYDTRRFPPTPVDLVINFGAKIGRVTKGARLVHVSTDSDSIGRLNEVDLPILAHVSTFIADLSDAVDGMLTADRITKIRTDRTAATTAYTKQLRQAREESLRFQFDQAPLSWDRVGHELEKVLDKNAVIVPELGPTAGNKVLGYLSQGIDDKLRIGRTTGSALGWGMGAAFGAQLALPDRQVVSIQGDGGLLFGQTETFWTISRYDAPILIVIMNNYSYNETRSRNLTSNGRQFQTGRELTSYLGDPKVDFSKIAEGYSIKGEKVKTPTDLVAGLQRALKTMKDGRPYLLDVEVAPDSIMGDSTWHPNFSIAQLGKRRKNSSWADGKA